MALTVKILELGRVIVDSAFLVRGRQQGDIVSCPAYGYLILGGKDPFVVDTGYRNAEVMQRIGMDVELPDGQTMEAQLAKHGLELSDIGAVVMTHLHPDHAGQIDKFPITTPVVVNRRELEFAASGIQGPLYAVEDLRHCIDRAYTPGGLQYLDLELSGPIEIAAGVTCVHTGGHTDGSMNVLVETDDGVACLCGDLIYDIQNQIVETPRQLGAFEPELTNNFSPTTRAEKASIKKCLDGINYLLPAHDNGATVEAGHITGRLEGLEVPGPAAPLPAPGGIYPVHTTTS